MVKFAGGRKESFPHWAVQIGYYIILVKKDETLSTLKNSCIY